LRQRLGGLPPLRHTQNNRPDTIYHYRKTYFGTVPNKTRLLACHSDLGAGAAYLRRGWSGGRVEWAQVSPRRGLRR